MNTLQLLNLSELDIADINYLIKECESVGVDFNNINWNDINVKYLGATLKTELLYIYAQQVLYNINQVSNNQLEYTENCTITIFGDDIESIYLEYNDVWILFESIIIYDENGEIDYNATILELIQDLNSIAPNKF